MTQKQIIKKQQGFISWLKKEKMYNQYESFVTMQKMQRVWEKAIS